MPYLGCLLGVDAEFHKFFVRMNETYGPIVWLDMGVKPTLVLQDPDLLRTVYKNPVRTLGSALDKCSGCERALSGVERS